MSLFGVTARTTDIQHRLHVWVDELKLVSVRIHFELATVVVPLQGDQVGEASNGSTLVFPNCKVNISNRDPIRQERIDFHQVAAVTRGILSSGGIAVSSMLILDR